MLTGVILLVGEVGDCVEGGGEDRGVTNGPGKGVNGFGYEGVFTSGDFVKPGELGCSLRSRNCSEVRARGLIACRGNR